MPSSVRGDLRVLGDRFQDENKGRLVLSGTLSIRGGEESPVQLIYELPGKFRLNQSGSNARTVGFDGRAPWSDKSRLGDEEKDLLESLAGDSVDAFFLAVRRGHALRVLGRRFRVDDGEDPADPGPWFDIYDLAANSPAVPEKALTIKRYYFDYVSRMLQKVCYLDGPAVVETRYSDWTLIGGQSIPGSIERVENGKTSFRLTTSGAMAAPRAEDGLFEPVGRR